MLDEPRHTLRSAVEPTDQRARNRRSFNSGAHQRTGEGRLLARLRTGGQRDYRQGGKPYSAKNLSGGEQVLDLAVPTMPGEYELRYRGGQGALRIHEHRPFRSIRPELRIQAAPAVIRRLPKQVGDYQIRCITNWGAGMQVYARKKLTIR